jgi:tetratricopeptide (TPR) repeat protein
VLAIVFAIILITWEGGVASRAIIGKATSTGGITDRTRASMNAAIGSKLNRIAWQQATNPDPSKRLTNLALQNALQAVSYAPDNAQFLDTIGVARYRTGDYVAAIIELEKSMKFGGFSASTTFFLAMARAKLGELDSAKKLYEDADRWMREHRSDDDELERFREEAAAVLYMKSLDVTKRPPEQEQRAPEAKPRAGTQAK